MSSRSLPKAAFVEGSYRPEAAFRLPAKLDMFESRQQLLQRKRRALAGGRRRRADGLATEGK